jgi:hypothetical protein
MGKRVAWLGFMALVGMATFASSKASAIWRGGGEDDELTPIIDGLREGTPGRAAWTFVRSMANRSLETFTAGEKVSGLRLMVAHSVVRNSREAARVLSKRRSSLGRPVAISQYRGRILRGLSHTRRVLSHALQKAAPRDLLRMIDALHAMLSRGFATALEIAGGGKKPKPGLAAGFAGQLRERLSSLLASFHKWSQARKEQAVRAVQESSKKLGVEVPTVQAPAEAPAQAPIQK